MCKRVCYYRWRGVKIVDMSCSKLKSKYEYMYSSFYVSVRVESMQFKKAIDLYMSPEAWPVGVLVKRFSNPEMDKCSFNCRSIKNSRSEVFRLCECSDLFISSRTLAST